MEEMAKHGEVGRAAMMGGMDRKTAGKYIAAGKLPSEMRAPRDWRTRKDPFEADWPEIAEKLKNDPGLEAKTIFDELLARHPDRYEEGQLRTRPIQTRSGRSGSESLARNAAPEP